MLEGKGGEDGAAAAVEEKAKRVGDNEDTLGPQDQNPASPIVR